MFKKLLSSLLALSIAAGTMTALQSVAMAENTTESGVIYEEDFESYVGGWLNSESSGAYSDNWGYQNQNTHNLHALGSSKALAATKNNKYIWYTLDEEISEGTLHISYDVGFDASIATTGDMTMGVEPERVLGLETIYHNLKTRLAIHNPNSNIMARKDLVHNDGNSIPNVNNGTHKRSRVDVFLEMGSAGGLDMYIDGKLLGTYDMDISTVSIFNGDAVKVIWFFLPAGVVIDNLKFSKLEDTAFEAKVEDITEDSFVLNFSQSLYANKTEKYPETAADGEAQYDIGKVELTKDNIIVEDKNGEVEIKSVEVIDNSHVKVNLNSSMVSLEEYTVTLVDVQNILGDYLLVDVVNYQAPKLPKRLTILDLDTAEDFTKFNSKYVAYQETDDTGAVTFDGAKLQVKATAQATGGYKCANYNSGSILLPENIYAVGKITVEYSAKKDTNVKFFRGRFAESGGTTVWMPYYNNATTYSYQWLEENHEGKMRQIKANMNDGLYHTYKTVFDADNHTVDVYVDGALLFAGLGFNNWYGFSRVGKLNNLVYDVQPASTSEVYTEIPAVTFDYFKITQEYEENDTGLYLLRNNVTEYGTIPGANKTNYYEAVDISAGETLYSEAYLLNLSGKPVSGYVLGSVYNGGRMTVAKGELKTAEHGEVLGGRMELPVADVTDLEVKSFLWDANGMPFAEAGDVSGATIVTE